MVGDTHAPLTERRCLLLRYDGQKKVRGIFLTPVDFVDHCFARTKMIRDILHGAVSCNASRYVKGCNFYADPVISFE